MEAFEQAETQDEYITYQVVWQDRTITIRHTPNWLHMNVQHIEIQNFGNEPLPITETGYRSCFLNGAEALAEFDSDPVRYVLAWLETASGSQSWQDHENESRQGSLF